MAQSIWIGWLGPLQFTSTGSGTIFPGQLIGPAADNTAAPPFSFTGDLDTGYASSAANTLSLVAGGTTRLSITSTAVTSTVPIAIASDSGTYSLGAASDAILARDAAAAWQLGVNAAGVTNQMLKGPDRITSDGVGGNLTIAGGRNRGASAGGSIIFQTAPAAGAGVTGTLATALTIDSTKLATFAGVLKATSTLLVDGAMSNTGGGAITTDRSLITAAGSNSLPPLTITNGTNLTTATANAVENDGVAFYTTNDTTNGRRVSDAWNFFELTGDGTGITTIADFFGATGSGIPLVANGRYLLEWHCVFTQATAGTATWTIVTATTALAVLDAGYIGTNIAGGGTVGAPQTAWVNTTASSSTALPVTGTEATGVTHEFDVRAVVTAGNGASNTRLRLTMSAGTATPKAGSYIRVTRLPAANTGTFAT